MPLARPRSRPRQALPWSFAACLAAALLILPRLDLGSRPSRSPAVAPGVADSPAPPVAAATAAAPVASLAPADAIVPPEPFPTDAPASPRGLDPRHAWLERWAARDFTSALAWARQQNQPLRDWALGGLATFLARRDPATALRLCETEELTLREPGLASVVFQHYAAAFPEKALAWAAALPPGRLRDLSADALFAAAAEHAPEIAGELVLHNAGDNPAAFVSLLGRWAQIAPARAGDWLAARPASELQSEALELLLAQWASVEHEPAAAWIATLPPGPFRARAEAAFALHRPAAPLSPVPEENPNTTHTP